MEVKHKRSWKGYRRGPEKGWSKKGQSFETDYAKYY